MSVSIEVEAAPHSDDPGDAEVPLPFTRSSFLLVAADDSLYLPAAWDGPTPIGDSVRPSVPQRYVMTFVSAATATVVRFVCTPREGTTPRSATWILKD